MTTITQRQARILYLLAKAGRPTRRGPLSRATARWRGRERRAVIDSLVHAGLVAQQTLPPGQGIKPGHFFWLTKEGQAEVARLCEAGVLQLPENWRQQHASQGAERLLDSASKQHHGP